MKIHKYDIGRHSIRIIAATLPLLLAIPSHSFSQEKAEVEAASEEPSDEVIELAPFEVVSDRDAGWRPTTTTVLTRTNRAIIDVPQSVDILSEEFLKDTSAFQMDEAFVYVANAQVRNSSSGTGPNRILIRGFNNSSTFTDGVETGSYRRDMSGYERMEIVKGPASAVQGRGTNSGYINFVLKKPIPSADFTRTSFSITSGKNGKTGYRFTADKNFDISQENGVSGRVAMVYDNHDSYIDFMEFKTAAIYPSIRWVINNKTDITLSTEFMDVEAPARTPGHGFAWIPTLYRSVIPEIGESDDPINALGLPQNFNIGGPGTSTDDTMATANLIITHRFNDAISFRQAFSTLKSTAEGQWWDAESNEPAPLENISDEFKTDPHVEWDPNGVYIPVQQGFIDSTIYRTNIQGDLNMVYGNDSIRLITLLGYAWEKRDSRDSRLAGKIPVAYSFINLKNPLNAWEGRTLEPGSIRTSRNRESFYDELGFYIQQDVNLFENSVLISGGYRTDTGTDNSEDYLNGTVGDETKTTVNSWRAAATYKVRDNISLYGLISSQNDPSVTGIVWSDLPPGDPRLLETLTRSPSTEMIEFGVKGTLFEGRVTATFSWYNIVRSGVTSNDRIDTTSQAPDTFGDPVFSALRRTVTDGDEADGIELSFTGKITDRWDMNLAYGTLNTTQPVSTTETRPIRHSPEYNGSIFTRYSFENEDGRGFAIRGGYSIIGPFMQQVGGSFGRIFLDQSQYRIDLGVSYSFNRSHNIDIIAKNVTNESYIVTRTNPPAEIRLTYNASF